MKIQTVFKAGNSDVVAIPAEVKKKTGIKNGSSVIVDVASDGKTIVISSSGAKNKRTLLTPDFLEWLREFDKQYGPALKELAKR